MTGKPREPLSALGWAAPLEIYRPFLSYSELGALVAGRPAEMHDAIQAILGLDLLIEAEKRLTEARKQADTASKQAKDALPALLELRAAHDDPRARQAETALTQRVPDLAAIKTLTAGAAGADDTAVTRLRLITAITLPGTETAEQEAVRAFQAAKAGTHEAYRGDLLGVVRDTERLARALRA